MALTFLPGTKLILEDSANNGYEFLVSEITVSQTYIESSRDTRTLHNKNLIKDTFIKQESNANFTFTINFSNTDEVIMRWLGATESNGEYKFPTIKDSLLEGDDLMTIYIDSGNTIFKITKCAIETMSLGLEKKSPLTVSITGQGQSRTEIPSLPSFSTYSSQGSFRAGAIVATIGGVEVSNVSGASFDVTRTLIWLNQNTVQQGLSNTLYQKSTPMLLDAAISGQITKNKTDDSNSTVSDTDLVIVYNNTFTISLDSCNLTDRWEVSAIYKKVTDYKLLPSSTNPFIKF